jgi:hypothetical protein
MRMITTSCISLSIESDAHSDTLKEKKMMMMVKKMMMNQCLFEFKELIKQLYHY